MVELSNVTPWLPIVAMVIGLATQGVMIAYFVGRMREGTNSTRELVNGLILRLDRADLAALERAREDGGLAARLDHLERNTAGLNSIPAEIARLGERFHGHQLTQEKTGELLRTDMQSLQRQLQQLMLHGGGKVIAFGDQPKL